MTSVEVFITFIESEGPMLKIWGQIDRSSAIFVERLILQYSEQFERGVGVPHPASLQTNQLCCAKYGGDGVYYRARILNIDNLSGKVGVQFIDYGNSEVVSIGDVRLLSAVQTSPLITIPNQAEEFFLSGIIPILGEWDKSGLTYIRGTICYMELNGIIVSKTCNKKLLLLLLNNEDFSQILIDKKLGISITITAQEVLINGLYGDSTGHNANYTVPPPFVSKAVSQDFMPVQSPVKNGGVLPSKSQGIAKVFTVHLLDVNTEHMIRVSHVEDGPMNFAIQVQCSENSLSQLTMALNDLNPKPLTEPLLPGSVCLARVLFDEPFCRAVVTNVMDNECKLYFVDFGSTNIVPYSQIYELPHKYWGPKCFALQFALAGIKGIKFDERAKKLFEDIVSMKLLKLRVVQSEGPPIRQYGELYFNGDSILRILLERMKYGGIKEFYREVVPPKIGQVLDVIVSYVDTVNNFYIQIKSSQKKLSGIMEKLDRCCNDDSETFCTFAASELYMGMPVCALYSVDQKWYRAKVMSVVADRVSILYVDYGNTDILPVTSLRKMDSYLSKIVPQAIPCSLVGFQDLENSEAESIKFEEVALNDVLSMKVVEHLANGMLLVELTDRRGVDMRSNILQDEVPMPESPFAGEILFHAGFARDALYQDLLKWEESKKLEDGADKRRQKNSDGGSWRQDQSERSNSNRWKDSQGDGSWHENNRNTAKKWNAENKDRNDRKWNTNENDKWSAHDTRRTEKDGEGHLKRGNYEKFRDEKDGGHRNRGQGAKITGDRKWGGSDTRSTGRGSAHNEDPNSGAKWKDSSNTDRPKHWKENSNSGKPWKESSKDYKNKSWNTKQSEAHHFSKESDKNPKQFKCGNSHGSPNYNKTEKKEFSSLVLPLGSVEDVELVYAASPSDFVLQIVKCNSQLTNMMEQIAAEYSAAGSKTNLDESSIKIGMPCIARYTEDNTWYRAVVENIDQSSVQVEFIDYGNKENVPCSDVKCILPQFLTVPIFGVRCNLIHTQTPTGGWTSDEVDEFLNLTDGKQLQAHIIKKRLNTVDVILRNLEEDIDRITINEKFGATGEDIKSVVQGLKVAASPKGSQSFAAVTDKYKEVPVQIGETVEVEVAWFFTPSKFYCKCLSNHDAELFRSMVQNIQTSYQGRKPLSSCVPVGSPIIARYPVDNVLYRAVVEEVLNANLYRIQYVDYGNSEVLDVSDMWNIELQFMELPRQAILCSLKSVKPVNEEWPLDANYFNEYFGIEKLSCRFEDHHEKSGYLVSLYKDASSIALLLIASKLAVEDSECLNSSEIMETQCPILEEQPVQLKEDEPYNLELCRGQQLAAHVTYIEGVAKFFVHLEPIYAKHLQLRIQQFENKQPLDANMEKDHSLCLASPDGIEWYRGRITSFSETTGACVEFIDFGDCDEVPFSNLRTIPPEFIGPRAQATECYVTGSKENRAPDDLEDLFKTEVEDQDVILLVDDVVDERLSVRLFDIEGQRLELLKTISCSSTLEIVPVCPMPILFSKVNVWVSHVDGPHAIWFHRVSETKMLEKLLDDLYIFYETEDHGLACSVQEEMICAAKSANDSSWYRAKVKSITGDDVSVHFIDYGNIETIPIDNVRELDPSFYSPHALSCSASLGVIAKDEGKCCELINNKICDQEFLVLFEKTKSGKWQVDTEEFIDLVRELILSDLAVQPEQDPFGTSDSNQPIESDLAIQVAQVSSDISIAVEPITSNLASHVKQDLPTVVCITSDLHLQVEQDPAIISNGVELDASDLAFQVEQDPHHSSNTDIPLASDLVLQFQQGPPHSSNADEPVPCDLAFQVKQDPHHSLNTDNTAASDPVLQVEQSPPHSSNVDDPVASDPVLRVQQGLPHSSNVDEPVPSDLSFEVEQDLHHSSNTDNPVISDPVLQVQQGPPHSSNVDEPVPSDLAFQIEQDLHHSSNADNPVVSDPILQIRQHPPSISSAVDPTISDLSQVKQDLSGTSDSVELDAPDQNLQAALDPRCTTDKVQPEIDKDSMDIQNNVGCSVVISHVNSATEFWIQDENYIPCLQDVADSLLNAADFPVLKDVKKGDFCAALFQDDEQWYRAIVLEILDSHCSVRYIDYGNIEYCSDLRALPEDLIKKEPLAKCCSLVLPDCIESWSSNANVKLAELAADGMMQFQMEVISEGNPMFVSLKHGGKDVGQELLPFGIPRDSGLKFSNSLGNHTPVYISHVISPSDFWVQSQSSSSQLDDVTDQLANAENFEPFPEAAEGAVCAALFSEDEQWYRAKIISCRERDIEVLFIDYGNSASTTDLQSLPPELLNIPPLAKHCSLPLPNNWTKWPQLAEEEFLNIFGDGSKKFELSVLQDAADCTIVSLTHKGLIVENELEKKCLEIVVKATSSSEDTKIAYNNTNESNCSDNLEETSCLEAQSQNL